MRDVYAIIMAGGSGERFWPESRLSKPKQLLPIVSKNTMIQETGRRILAKISSNRVLIVAGAKHQGQIGKQLPRIKKENIIVEPWGRNTASAIGLSALWVKRKDPNGIMVVLPSDHVIKDKTKFFSNISAAISAARSGNKLIAIGLSPKSAFTGYGYIKKGSKVTLKGDSGEKLFTISKFAEKPNQTTASEFFDSGKYLWNAGIFVWKAKDILEAISKYMPQLSRGLSAIEPKLGTREYFPTVKKVYGKIKSISIDNGILEKAKNIYVVASDMEWNDVGSWANIASYGKTDSARNVSRGLYKAIDTTDSIIISSNRHLIGAVGLSDIVVVHTKDATLVCRKDRAQDVKELVGHLKKSHKFNKFI